MPTPVVGQASIPQTCEIWRQEARRASVKVHRVAVHQQRTAAHQPIHWRVIDAIEWESVGRNRNKLGPHGWSSWQCNYRKPQAPWLVKRWVRYTAAGSMPGAISASTSALDITQPNAVRMHASATSCRARPHNESTQSSTTITA